MKADEFIGGQFEWFTGIVKEIDDDMNLNRVKVHCLGFYDGIGDNKHLPWATVIMPATTASMKGNGGNHHLEVGSWVVGFFRDGPSAQDPMIMGSVATQTDDVQDIPTESSVENKVYKSKAGHLIEIDNTAGAERLNVKHTSGTTILIDAEGGIQIDDTRSANSPPSFYRAKGVNKYFEFKTKSAIGTPSTQEYNYLETIVKWGDASGGGIEQIAYGENIYYRQSTDENTWGPWRTIAPDASGTLIATKPDNWNSAIQIGSTNDPKDSNIYSLSFGKAQDGTWTGMGLVPNDKKAFTDSTGPVLGTHIQEMSEWGIMSSGWNKLFAVQGKTGNVNVKGKLNAGGDIKANNFYTSSSNSFSEMKVNDKGVLFRNGTNQDRSSDGGPKTFTVRNDDGDLRLMASGGEVRVPQNAVIDSMWIGGQLDNNWKRGLNIRNNDGTWTHFNHNSVNYIRGQTEFQKQLRTAPGKGLCNSDGSICVDVADIVTKDKEVNLINKNWGRLKSFQDRGVGVRDEDVDNWSTWKVSW